MGLFGKKKDEKKTSCCCSDCSAEAMETAEKSKRNGAQVKILGTGCTKCNQLEANTQEALKQLGMNTDIDHITDFVQISAYGVMTTPALVIDGKVVAFGKVLTTDEVIELLKKVR